MSTRPAPSSANPSTASGTRSKPVRGSWPALALAPATCPAPVEPAVAPWVPEDDVVPEDDDWLGVTDCEGVADCGEDDEDPELDDPDEPEEPPEPPPPDCPEPANGSWY